MNKTVKKTLTITGIVIGSLIALFLLLYLIMAIIGAASYGEARSLREYVCDIPEINGGIAPQGLTYSKEEDLYILTGYTGGNLTLLHIVEDGKSRRVNLVDQNGDAVKGHAGGVTCTKDRVYIANDSTLLMFSLSELKNATADTKVAVKQSFAVDNTAAYCFSDDEYLFVGEFYRAGNYETEKSHHYTTPDGQENKAIVSCYKLDNTGLLQTTDGQAYPLFCISVTGLVQGFAAYDGTCILSRSYGLSNSRLEYHSQPIDSGKTISVKFKYNENAMQKDMPLYYLDSTTNIKTLTLPAFSEDVTIVNGRVAVTNESAANKYFVGKLFDGGKVYSYPIYKK